MRLTKLLPADPRRPPPQPVSDGPEVAARIRAVEHARGLPRTPIVALAAECTDEEARGSRGPCAAITLCGAFIMQ